MSPSYDDHDADSGPWGPWEADGVVLSQEQRDAVTQVLTGSDFLTILTGVAGAGKSLVTHFLRRTGMVTVTATTGKAAINVGGITVDSLFCFNRTTGLVWGDPDFIERRLHLDCERIILIDEASMLSMVMLRTIIDLCRENGIRLVLVGDWGQASPVVTNAANLAVAYPGMEVIWPTDLPEFQSHRLIRLTECHRQSDSEFLAALNEVRTGRCPRSADELFRSRVAQHDHPFFDYRCLRMFATNRSADGYNREKLNQLVSLLGIQPTWIEARFKCHRKKPYTAAQELAYLTQSPLAHRVPVCDGARILFVRNENPVECRRYVNGDTGVLTGVTFDEQGFPASIRVKLDRTESEIEVLRIGLTACDPKGRELYSIYGFPIRLGWAMTVHKTQGLSTDYAWLDMRSLNAMRYAGGQSALHGLAYVGLSRCRSLSGLYLSGWDPGVIWSDPKVRNLL